MSAVHVMLPSVTRSPRVAWLPLWLVVLGNCLTAIRASFLLPSYYGRQGHMIAKEKRTAEHPHVRDIVHLWTALGLRGAPTLHGLLTEGKVGEHDNYKRASFHDRHTKITKQRSEVPPDVGQYGDKSDSGSGDKDRRIADSGTTDIEEQNASQDHKLKFVSSDGDSNDGEDDEDCPLDRQHVVRRSVHQLELSDRPLMRLYEDFVKKVRWRRARRARRERRERRSPGDILGSQNGVIEVLQEAGAESVAEIGMLSEEIDANLKHMPPVGDDIAADIADGDVSECDLKRLMQNVEVSVELSAELEANAEAASQACGELERAAEGPVSVRMLRAMEVQITVSVSLSLKAAAALEARAGSLGGVFADARSSVEAVEGNLATQTDQLDKKMDQIVQTAPSVDQQVDAAAVAEIASNLKKQSDKVAEAGKKIMTKLEDVRNFKEVLEKSK